MNRSADPTFMVDYLLNLSIANLTDLQREEEDRIRTVVAIVVPIFFGIIFVLGFIGNSLVVVVVAANPNMRSTTNILIINLAIADLLFVVFCIPFTGTDFVLPYWPFGNIWCKIVQYLIIVTACASVYTLVLMSFDRWVKKKIIQVLCMLRIIYGLHVPM